MDMRNTTLDDTLARAVEDGSLPFVVAMTGDAAGPRWAGSAGDIAPDALFRIYSMTKAIGALAATILVDRGQLALDTPVAQILPEWDDLPLLAGWDGDRPVLRRPHRPATIRHLATHRSGLEYDMWNADVKRYAKVAGVPRAGSGQLAALAGHPLTFEPGTRWGYGISTDWLGRVVEAVDGRRIDAFCRDEILGPLGMHDTLFELGESAGRLAPAYRRQADGGFEALDLAPPSQPGFYGMGHALYSTAPDYMRFLRMVLNGGVLDGRRLLSAGAMRAFCADQMEGVPMTPLRSVMPWMTEDLDLFPGVRASHSLAFLRIEEDVPGRRSAGSLGWAGVCNTHYWIDPARDLAAVFMTQCLPFIEPGVRGAYDRFEQAVYAGI